MKHLSFSFLGVGGATLITFGFNTVAIRSMGPVEYGKWTLIGSVADLLVILPLWGLTSSALRYLGASRDHAQKIVGTSARTVLLLSLLFVPIYLLLESPFRALLNIPASLYNYALLYAPLLAFSSLFQSFFQGLEQFKQLAYFRIASAVVFALVVVFYLLFADSSSFYPLLSANLAMLTVPLIAGLIVFKRDLPQYDSRLLRPLIHYGSYDMITVFVGFFTLGSMDTLMINHFLGQAAVGLYAAYYMGFSIFSGRIMHTFSQTFFPMASTLRRTKDLIPLAITMVRRLSGITLLANFALIWFLFQLYGPAFTFEWRLGALMAASTTLYGMLRIFGNIIASTGISGARIGLAFSLSSAVLNVGFNLLLIPRFGLYGTIIATIATSLFRMMLAVFVMRKLP